jgi:molecular chaperone GrpE
MNPSENPAPVAASGADASASSVPPPAAGEGAAPPLSGDVAKLEAELAQARKEAADHYDRYVRVMADFENARKRTIREKEELRQFAAARVLEDLIPVLDSLALAMGAAKAPTADLKSLVGGVDLVVNQAKAALGQHGLKELNPFGQPFDPNLHESIAAQPSAEVPEGSVATVVRTGYSLHGRVLRPASVILSSGSQAAANAN